MCESLSIRYSLILILFGVLAPTMDQVSDLALVIRLMSGPEINITLNSGDISSKDVSMYSNILVPVPSYPTRQQFNTTFQNQPPVLQGMYTAVSNYYRDVGKT